MKKMLYGILLFAVIFCFGMNVYAKENVYYTNDNGVELSEKEYNFLKTFFYENYPEIMTQDQYNDFIEKDLMSKKIQIKKIYDKDNSKSPYHGTANKSLQISSACSSYCYMSLTATWFNSPSVRSYDVIGAYLSGPSLVSHDYTYVSSSAGYDYFYNVKQQSNGFGNSILLPSTGSNIVISQGFTLSGHGTVYGSYQHAAAPVTLAQSKNYNISFSGYGHVFDFYGTAVGMYDGMAGVDITI